MKVIYDRDKEIETFVPENYYKLVATFKTQREEEFEATYMEEQEDKFKTKNTLDEIYNILQRSSGVVLDKQVERKREYPPFLFNLSNLQGYVTSKYKGWTSDKVLKVAQSLYEKKYITYPRTGSTALEESLVGRAAKVLEAVKKDYHMRMKSLLSKRNEYLIMQKLKVIVPSCLRMSFLNH